jgi:hypothetical protein
MLTVAATLTTTVRDIAAVPGSGDTNPGDIRKAKVSFVNRATGAPFQGCANLAVTLVNGSDVRIGRATCTTTLAVSNTGGNRYVIGTQVTNYYSRASAADDVVVEVAKPFTSFFVSGGGFVPATNSAGSHPGDPGSPVSLGTNARFTQSQTSFSGGGTVLIRSAGHVYQIEAAAISSGVVAVPHASLSGPAVITDVTNPGSPVTIDADATMVLAMTDNGASGDTVGIQVMDHTSALWFSSDWNGTSTVEQVLGGGTVSVLAGARTGVIVGVRQR